MAAVLTGRYTVFGNTPVYIGTFTMASTSVTGAALVPGISRIKAAQLTPVSGATSVFSIHLNVNSAGSAVNGWLDVTSALSSNIFSVVVYGEE